MTKMFYVIMNRDLYLHRDEEQYTMDYDNAARFQSSEDAGMSLDCTNTSCRVVGPCKEGEEP